MLCLTFVNPFLLINLSYVKKTAEKNHWLYNIPDWNFQLMTLDQSKLEGHQLRERKKTIAFMHKTIDNFKNCSIPGDYKRYGYFLSPGIGDNTPHYNPYYALEVAYGLDLEGNKVPVFICILQWTLNQQASNEVYLSYVHHPDLIDSRETVHGLKLSVIETIGVSPLVAKEKILSVLSKYVTMSNGSNDIALAGGQLVVTRSNEFNKNGSWVNDSLQAFGIKHQEVVENNVTIIGIEELFDASTNKESFGERATVKEIAAVLCSPDKKSTMQDKVSPESIVENTRALLKIIRWVYRLFVICGNPVPLPTTDEIKALINDTFKIKMLSNILISESWEGEMSRVVDELEQELKKKRTMDEMQFKRYKLTKIAHRYFQRVINCILPQDLSSVPEMAANTKYDNDLPINAMDLNSNSYDSSTVPTTSAPVKQLQELELKPQEVPRKSFQPMQCSQGRFSSGNRTNLNRNSLETDESDSMGTEDDETVEEALEAIKKSIRGSPKK